MKRANIIAVVVAAALLGGCGGPRIIPNEKLARIFHDIYLVNGYVSQSSLDVDSLNIYESVFAAHGYTSEDIQYTIGSFAKRKSAHLSRDVVEVAAEMLRLEAAGYRRRIEIRDTVALVARERFSVEVYSDSLIRARRVSDTSRLRITIPGIREGSYRISYVYRIDSLDRNLSLRSDAWLIDSTGRRSGSNARRLERERRGVVETTLSATPTHRRLVISLGGYPRDLTAPHLTIDSLRVVWLPPEEEAVWRLQRSWYGRGGVIDSLFPREGFGR
jgi:outer membrane murein-binding lipoprotein Lpp